MSEPLKVFITYSHKDTAEKDQLMTRLDVNNRGAVYIKKGDYNCTIKDYDKVIELEPNNAKAYYIRGEMWLHLRNWNKARSDLKFAKSKGMDIIAVFCEIHNNVAAFEQKYGAQLPEDIAAMLA